MRSSFIIAVNYRSGKVYTRAILASCVALKSHIDGLEVSDITLHTCRHS